MRRTQPDVIPKRVAALISLAAVAVAFWANVARAESLQMQRLAPGWHISAISAAVAVNHFGHPLDYTGLDGIRDEFLARVNGSDSATLNQAIAHILTLDLAVLPSGRHLLGTDDKGVVDFVRLSFAVFGYQVEGFLYTYFLILGLSAACFAVSFYRRPEAMFLLAAFLCAHLALLPTVVVNPELKSVIAMRFMPVVSLVAVLHLLLYVFRPLRGLGHVVPMLAQIGIIVFTVHVRQSAMWQVGAVMLGGVIALASRADVTAAGAGRWLQARHLLRVVWPCAALLAGFIALKAYQQLTYAEPYRRGDQIAGHVFWHSLFTGFAFHPTLGPELNVKVDDVSVARAAGRYLVERGRAAEWEAIGGTSPGFRDVRWAPYDQVVREMYLDVWRRRPVEAVTSALVYRPVAFVRMLAWLGGFTSAPPYLELVNEDGQRAFMEMHHAVRDGGFAYRPIQTWTLVTLAPFLLVLAPAGALPLKTVLGPAAVFLLGALSPTILVYPYAHTIGEPAIATTMLVYALTMVIGLHLTGKAVARYRSAFTRTAVEAVGSASKNGRR